MKILAIFNLIILLIQINHLISFEGRVIRVFNSDNDFYSNVDLNSLETLSTTESITTELNTRESTTLEPTTHIPEWQ